MINKLLSVIVPVYNREKTIVRCIQSIREQTYQNLEILLINDGSTDHSKEICEEYARKDTRIKLYHQENAGASAARKWGVVNASGDYITFVDSDDWIENDMYERMLEKCETYQADVVCSGIICERDQVITYEKDTVVSGQYDRKQIKEKIIPIMMFDRKYGKRGITGSLWNKIFSSKLIRKAFLQLNPLVTYGDDALTVYSIIAGINRLYVCEESWYHYCVHGDSLVQSYGVYSFEKICLLKKSLTETFKKMKLLDVMQEQINQYVRSFLRGAVRSVYEMEMEQISYLFPYELVPCGSRIILYGAGIVGKSYQICLKNGNYAVLVAWVDQNSQLLKKQGRRDIESPERIHVVQYDFIVIAVENREVAANIKKMLVKQGIEEEKILWNQPIRICS